MVLMMAKQQSKNKMTTLLHALLIAGLCMGLSTITEARSLHRRSASGATGGATGGASVATGAVPSIFSCSFEGQTLCLGDQARGDEFDWTIHSGFTPSNSMRNPTGPYGAIDGKYYIYTEASSPRKDGDRAIYLLPSLHAWDEDFCVEFAYSMNGHHVNTLQLVQMDTSLFTPNTQPQVEWFQSGNQGAGWTHAYVNVHVKPGFRLAFIGIRGGGVFGDIALDDIAVYQRKCADQPPPTTKVPTTTSTTTTTTTEVPTTSTTKATPPTSTESTTKSTTPTTTTTTTTIKPTTTTTSTTTKPTTTTTTTTPTTRKPTTTTTTTPTTTTTFPDPNPDLSTLFSCSFEDDEGMCGAIQDSTDDDLDWTRQTRGTPSTPTGPESAYHGDYYVYMEASNQRPGALALLHLPSVDYAGPACVTFAYSMNGFHVRRLDLVKRGDTEQEAGNLAVSLWNRENDQGEGWMEAQVDVDLMPGVQLGFLATRGGGYSGDIAIDAISVTRGPCQDDI